MKTIFQALAEPNRLQIVELLRTGPLGVGEIAERLSMSQPQTSKHLKVLSEAGLLQMEAAANRRIYRLSAGSFQELEAWASSFRRDWEQRMDRLDDYLSRLQDGK
ncbi:ArsR/SmtB family transcription factor [Paenibacillus herberti]|uniref:Transcriptional regulator n=1 Tax=Paenibacillus herberti TaxID=1619309 RepID=A0A229P649_9BACL|nr:metalloregulator ArsR/SmtB family transcription factor [Paenibacillus herberti]OXM17531.1 transcriptional regulator [Paenibacillus herberti]